MKKVLNMLCAMMVMGLVLLGSQSTVWASAELERIVEPFDLTQAEGDVSGNGWQWQNDARTLIFNGINIRMNYPMPSKTKMERNDFELQKMALFTVPPNTTLILKDGSINTMHLNAKAAIKAQDGLTVRGQGMLNVNNVEGNAILIEKGDLIINDGKFEINVSGRGLDVVVGNCIFNNGQLNMITCNFGSQGYFKGVINAENVIINGGKITTKNEQDIGIYANKVLTINGGEIDLLMADKMATGNALTGERIVINAGNVTIKNAGTGMIASGSLEGNGIEVNGGTVRLIDGSRGIIMGETSQLRMNGGELHIDVRDRALGGLANDESAPKLVMNGGKLNVKGQSAIAWLMLEAGEKDLSSQLIQIGENMVMETEGTMQKTKVIFAYVNGKKEIYYAYSLVPEGWQMEQTTHSREPKYGVSTLTIAPKNEGQEDSDRSSVREIVIAVNDKELVLAEERDGTISIDDRNRTIIPLRVLTEAMGYKAVWDEAEQSITITGGEKGTVIFYINEQEYTINGEVKTMDTTAVVSAQGRTYVPLRFVAESLGATVEVTTKTDGTSRITIVTADAVA